MPYPAAGGARTGGLKTIRLAYHGCTNRPFFHIVVMQKKLKRQEQCIEQLGTYDPLPNVHGEKLCALNLERITYWMGQKVLISGGVSKLFGLIGLTPIHPHTYTAGWEARRKLREKKEAAEEDSADT